MASIDKDLPFIVVLGRNKGDCLWQNENIFSDIIHHRGRDAAQFNHPGVGKAGCLCLDKLFEYFWVLVLQLEWHEYTVFPFVIGE